MRNIDGEIPTLYARLMGQLITPKLSAADKRKSLYPYYAGYSESFVEWVLDQMGAKAEHNILDPWNGTGTTTAVAALRGMNSTGVDINPVLSFVAKARLASPTDRKNIADWIADWNDPHPQPALSLALRTYQHAAKSGAFVSGSPAEALLVVGIFPVIRKKFQSLKTKNPSWFSQKSIDRDGIDDILTSALEIKNSINETIIRQSRLTDFKFENVTLINSDLNLVTLPSHSFDFIVTSPPYLTRIDYVQATLPELYTLDAIGLTAPRMYLRRRMIGSPLTGPVQDEEVLALPLEVRNILDAIKWHDSKASSTYYWRFFARYFIDMRSSIIRMSDFLKSDGKICMVTQPSYYKEILIDLPSLLSSLAFQTGLNVTGLVEFDTKISMVAVNSRAHASTHTSPKETAAFYEPKQGDDK